MNEYDALVLGAGPAGSSTAFFLAQAGWKVGIVEKTPFPRRKVCGEFVSAATRPVLDAMGIGEVWSKSAGPFITRVGLFAGSHAVTAPMPFAEGSGGWGRALSRDRLDLMLVEAAQGAGAELWQPWKAVSLARDGEGHRCTIQKDGVSEELRAKVVIAAHGSWEPGTLPTQIERLKSPSDILCFKFYFANADIEDNLMPLVAFPGGYGGLAAIEPGLVGFSCCIRRDVLQRSREKFGTQTAADAVLRHVKETTAAMADMLGHANEPQARLAAGPIRPGIRPRYEAGIFRVGNAAGEAQPTIAEGISMAIQGGHLLAQSLINAPTVEEAGKHYSKAWNAQFSTRIRAASFFALLSMNPSGAALMAGTVKRLPKVITWCASLSGKTAALNANPIA